MRITFIIILFLIISFQSYSQSLDWSEAGELQAKISTFISNYDSVYMERRPTEFVYIIFEIDSNGSIEKIHLMGVETDSLFKILKGITVKHFLNWKCIKCKGKKIIAPYFYISDNPVKSHADKLFSDFFRTIQTGIIFRETHQTIFIKYLFSLAPLHPKQRYKKSITPGL